MDVELCYMMEIQKKLDIKRLCPALFKFPSCNEVLTPKTTISTKLN